MTSPHYISSEEFARDLIRLARSLTPEQKAEVRTTLYKWSDERLAKKPADLGKN